MPRSFLLLVFLLLLPFLPDFAAKAQGRYLALDKPGSVKRLRFRSGDEIAIKLKGDQRVYRDVIMNMNDTALIIMQTAVPIRDIRAIVVYRDGGLARAALTKLPIAGILYFLAATYNPVFRNEPPDYHWSNAKVGGIIAGSGLLMIPLLKKTYRINNFRTLKVLQEY
jgi:hypothetical protein